MVIIIGPFIIYHCSELHCANVVVGFNSLEFLRIWVNPGKLLKIVDEEITRVCNSLLLFQRGTPLTKLTGRFGRGTLLLIKKTTIFLLEKDFYTVKVFNKLNFVCIVAVAVAPLREGDGES